MSFSVDKNLSYNYFMKLKIAYFGTPNCSMRLLETLLRDKDIPVEVTLVVTQPDKPVGRKQILTPSPVKEMARQHNIDLYDDSISQLLISNYALLQKHDLALLYAYGDIIPNDLLKAPKYGFWNLHPSLLPRYRGASPIAYPLILGDNETGVTLIQMDQELDHGPIIAQKKCEILPTDKRPDLEAKLTDLGYELFKKTISNGKFAQVSNRAQDEQLATYTRRLTKQDGFLPLSLVKKTLRGESIDSDKLPPILNEYLAKYPICNFQFSIFNFYRGLWPWPGIWTLLHQDFAGQAKIDQHKRLKITDLEMQDNKITIKKVQLEGKKEVTFEELKKRYKV